MEHTTSRSRFRASILLAVMLSGMACAAASAAVTVIGTQYQQDNLYTEYNCIWNNTNYPTSCPTPTAGCNAHVYLKNTGGSSVTVSDVTLAGYSLITVIKEKVQGNNDAYSIYYYWQDPPQEIFDAGEPVWYKADPPVIPAGGVSQVVIRLRIVPETQPISIGVIHTAGTTTATVAVDSSGPQLASVGFSPDLDKVYLHWRRSGGAGPTTIKLDGTDITASCTTVSNANLDFAATTYTPGSALSYMSYHVYQGVYSDGKTATASLRSWVNPFNYGTYGAGPTTTWDDARDWIDTCDDRGVNLLIYNLGSDGLIDFLNKQEGQDYASARDYGFAISSPSQWNVSDPRMWYLRDEPDAHDWNVSTGTGWYLPPGRGHSVGALAMAEVLYAQARLPNFPEVPSSINIDGTFAPHNFCTYGQLADIGLTDPYYQKRLTTAYWENTNLLPLYEQATYIYATSKAMTTACEPNPSNVILYSCEYHDSGNPDLIWPYAPPACKRIEAYYALAGGAKGMGYWWFIGVGGNANGLGSYTDDALALWKEIGLLGNEFRAARPIIVTSHPVDMTVTGSNNIWVKPLASGTDTLMLVVVNDDYYNDIDGCHYTAVSNASVTATLPSWMTSSPYAFEVTADGIYDVTSSLNGSALTVTLGTVNVTRMIIVTTNANLQSTIAQRYQDECQAHVCNFAPDHCSTLSITTHPSAQNICAGSNASFSVAATGEGTLTYQWQKAQANISNGGHYSGCTTATLAVTGADTNDVANYRCVVTDDNGSANSNEAALSLKTATSITTHPTNQSVASGGTANFTVVAAGDGMLTYQWQKNSANQSNGGHYSGCTTATLTISTADTNDQANYRCIVTATCGSATSNQASLTVGSSCGTPSLTNGNFEYSTAANPPYGWTTYIQSSKSGNWTIQTVTPPQGTQWQQTQTYNTGAFGGVRQNVTGLTSGSIYTISGSYKTNSTSATAAVRYSLSGDTTRANSTVLVSKTATSWGTFSADVTASGTSLMLFLDHQNGTSSNKASAYDNIRVVCKP